MGRHHRAGLDGKHMQQQLAEEPGCAVCGQRLGKHQWSTDLCPNKNWQPGRPQWLASSYADLTKGWA